ncbi:MAG: OFA family MFS transporter [Phycisphaerales bacterium]|nr:OFA family MFS transporter [Phycisphaerales bacterium]
MATFVAIHPAVVPDLEHAVRRSTVLVGAVLVQLILGTVYGYSIFWQPLEAEIWPPILTQAASAAAVSAPSSVPDTTAAGLVAPQVVIVEDVARLAQERQHREGLLKYSFAICLLAFAASMVAAGRVQDVKGPRFTAVIGGLTLGTAFLLAGFMNSPAVYYVCHALSMGVCVVVLLTVFDYLTRRRSRSDDRGDRAIRSAVVGFVPYGIMTAVIVGGVALGRAYISTSPANKVFLLWGTVGLLAGAGIGFAYVCPIAALVKWFPRHKGLVSGVAVAGFGLGAYVFSGRTRFGGVGFIETHGIETFFRVHGVIAAAVVCGGAMLLRNPPVPAARPSVPGEPVGSDTTWQELLRSGRFYAVWAMFFSGAMAGLMVIGILKPFAGSQLLRAAETAEGVVGAALRNELLLKGATAVGVLALFNAAGRVLWGWLSDRIGRSVTMTAMFVFQGVTLLCLTGLDSEMELTIGAACVGFNFGGNFALFPSLTADLFGSRNFGANYGWVFTSYGVAGVLGVWAGNAAQNLTGSYFAAFGAAACLCFASGVLSLLLGRTRAAATA